MNIKQMIENGSNALFLVSAADLKEFGLALIAEALQQPQQQTGEKYLSAGEVSELLKVSQNTLWRWSKTGYLVPIKVGRTSQYKQSDIDHLRKGNS